jgi:DNA-binding NarL/FixJ family response regulator
MTGLEWSENFASANLAARSVVLSAHLTQDNVQAYTALNVDLMLSKPFDVNELRKRVDALLEVSVVVK